MLKCDMLLRNAIYAAAYEDLYHIAGERNEPISQPNKMKVISYLLSGKYIADFMR